MAKGAPAGRRFGWIENGLNEGAFERQGDHMRLLARPLRRFLSSRDDKIKSRNGL